MQYKTLNFQFRRMYDEEAEQRYNSAKAFRIPKKTASATTTNINKDKAMLAVRNILEEMEGGTNMVAKLTSASQEKLPKELALEVEVTEPQEDDKSMWSSWTPATVNSVAEGTTPNKQDLVVGIQNLGANTVITKDGQLIVKGPDHTAVTQIVHLLSTGAAKVANLNGKQVLLIKRCGTAPAKTGQQAVPTTPDHGGLGFK